jgi:hypothetical protein
MKLQDVVRFRKDLLFDGAVQVGWFDDNPSLASRAAEHFVFHGPSYRGVSKVGSFSAEDHTVDTASFVHEVLKGLSDAERGAPFMLAISGYGTGKSHLALTLSQLLSNPHSRTAQRVLENLTRSDDKLGIAVQSLLQSVGKPYLVVTINGMKDFDVTVEVTSQILKRLAEDGLDTAALENVRPRFFTAQRLTEKLFDHFVDDFRDAFGPVTREEIIGRLKARDEDVFAVVSNIFSRRMGMPIRAVGQESLHDIIKVTKDNYCGAGKPYAGMLILFDEFGRYLEFALQKPHIAGPGALQQLFECVQANSDGVMLVCFVQYELGAYVSRVAPELRSELTRYISRYDSAQKVKLSTNLETIIANLLDKKDLGFIQKQLTALGATYDALHEKMKRWFPELAQYALWDDKELFRRVVCEGCWPLHPLSVWLLHKLTTAGRSLQQRSALSLLADVYDERSSEDFSGGTTILPADICNETLVGEFLASERFAEQGASAHAYEMVVEKYRNDLGHKELRVLKAVLLAAKLGAKVTTRQETLDLFAALSGLSLEETNRSLHVLEKELAALEWNETTSSFDITGDSVPKRAFLAYLADTVENINLDERTAMFVQNYKQWMNLDKYPTDFGPLNRITTQDWCYAVYLSDSETLNKVIDSSVRAWRNAFHPDDPKGQLIYCYVGPKSNLDFVKGKARRHLKSSLESVGISLSTGAPIAVVFLHDQDGRFGRKVAEYWLLNNGLGEEERGKYRQFITDRKQLLEREMKDAFSALEKRREIVFATDQNVPRARIQRMLTELLRVTYQKLIPFDFDGFGTSRGNAAKDSREFTCQLITARFDREWISTTTPQRKNRAHRVLVDGWGLLGDDGRLRFSPAHGTLREVVDLLTERLHKGRHKSLNLGEAMELLCLPPYGCNLASAGLIIAFFVGSRREQVDLLRNGSPISIEEWVDQALPKNFFELSVLRETEVVQVSEDNRCEWETLLDDWESAATIAATLEFQRKAQELSQKRSVPGVLRYKYESLARRASDLGREFERVNQEINSALDKIDMGKKRMDLKLVAAGASELVRIQNSMRASNKWEAQKIRDVEEKIPDSRLFIQTHFDEWLPTQKVRNIRNLALFAERLRGIANNLEVLGLSAEKESLLDYIKTVEERFQALEDATRLVAEIEGFLAGAVMGKDTKVATLKSWLQQIEKHLRSRDHAKSKHDEIDFSELIAAEGRLVDFQQEVQAALDVYMRRKDDVFAIGEITSADDLAFWRNEVTNLISIFEGEEQETRDLVRVQKQLSLAERHFALMNDMSSTNAELAELVAQCHEELRGAFLDGDPPLDAKTLYDTMFQKALEVRERKAAKWMEANVPALGDITHLSASEVQHVRSRLLAPPVFLSDLQASLVRQVVEACDARLDDLEVDGLLARYQTLSSKNKKRFLEAVFRDALSLGSWFS